MAESYALPLPTDKILPIQDYFRAIKHASEIAAIRRGVSVLDKVFDWVRRTNFVGKTEQGVAVEIAKVMKRYGAEALAFPIIVAAGTGSADIHHWPTKHRIQKGEIIMIDCGAVVGGQCSDCTRTFFLGNPSKTFIARYQEVLRAQEKAIRKIRDGIKAWMVDRAARNHLSYWRWGRTFRHGCGHGVGTAIHEVPNLKPNSPDVLHTGMVVTVEPGVYIKNWGGIRIEDMVLVQRRNHAVLTSAIPKKIDDIIINP